MADYVALLENGTRLPVVTHDTEGHALVYTLSGQLARASSLPSFVLVKPAGPKAWKVDGTFGSGAVKEVEPGEEYPWCR